MGFYNPVTMAMVYAGSLAAVPIGRLIRRGRRPILRVPVGSLAASTLFFLISNFGVWLAGWYGMTAAGLLSCYINAIPFYAYSLVGDLAFSVILFGVWEWSRSSQLGSPAILGRNVKA